MEKEIDIKNFMDTFTKTILTAFDQKVKFIGLQGSRSRNEHTPESDIDTVVIFDNISIEILKEYNRVIDILPHRDKLCGFISGKKEIENWDRAELFQFYNDTIPYYGNIDFIATFITVEDIKRSILSEACKIYHACCHNFIYEKSYDILPAILKSAAIIVQSKCYIDTGKYIKNKTELKNYISDEYKKIIDIYIKSRNDKIDFYDTTKELISFSTNIINSKN